MKESIITLRKNWLEDLISHKKSNKKYFFFISDDESEKNLSVKRNEILSLENPEKTLFKYRRLNSHTIDSVKNDLVHLTSPEKFNDPYDSRALNTKHFGLKSKKQVNQIFANSPFNKIVGWDKKNRKQRAAITSGVKTRDDLERRVKQFLPLDMQKGDLFEKELDLNRDQVALGSERTLISCFSSLKDSLLNENHASTGLA